MNCAREACRRRNANSARSLQRIDQRRLSHVGIANHAHRDRSLHAIIAAVVLEELEHVVRAQAHVARHHAGIRLADVHVVTTEMRFLGLRGRLEKDCRVLLAKQIQPLQ